MTNAIEALQKKLDPFIRNAAAFDESWARVDLEGRRFDGSVAALFELLGFCEARSSAVPLNVWVDGENKSLIDIQGFVERKEDISQWQINFSKNDFVSDSSITAPGEQTVWFLSQEAWRAWIKQLNPFLGQIEPLSEDIPCKMLVADLSSAFGGERIAVDNLAAERIPSEWPFEYLGPKSDQIRLNVHLIGEQYFKLAPSIFSLTWGDVQSREAQPMRTLSGRILAGCLAHECYSNGAVVIRGTRRIEFSPTSEEVTPSVKCLHALRAAVEWVFQERPEVRASLIADRLSLEAGKNQTLLSICCEHISDALKQSKEQYRFVILERKDAYATEVRELLRDAQSQVELFSRKTRSILNSLLRDVLASILLVGIGLYAKLIRGDEILEEAGTDLLFKAVGAYFVFSIALQVVVHLKDVELSRDELEQWTRITRHQVGLEKVDEYVNAPVSRRKNAFYAITILLSLAYLALAVIFWNLQGILAFFNLSN